MISTHLLSLSTHPICSPVSLSQTIKAKELIQCSNNPSSEVKTSSTSMSMAWSQLLEWLQASKSPLPYWKSQSTSNRPTTPQLPSQHPSKRPGFPTASRANKRESNASHAINSTRMTSIQGSCLSTIRTNLWTTTR